jgi:hypothetical protein
MQIGNDNGTASNDREADADEGFGSDDKVACDESEDMDTAEDQPACPFGFEIDPDINIDSVALRDMISMEPLVQESIPQASTVSGATVASNADPDWGW